MWSVVKSKVSDYSGASRDSIKCNISELIRKIDKEEVACARTCFWTRLRVVIDTENGFIVLVVEKKCPDDVKCLKYCFRVCSSKYDDFKLLEIFSRLCCPTLYSRVYHLQRYEGFL